MEEDGLPGDGSTVQIEEMGSFKYATQQSVSYQIQDGKKGLVDEPDSEAEVAEKKSTSRGISIMSVSEDDNNGVISREISVEERDIAMKEGNAKILMSHKKTETKETIVMEGNDLDDLWASKNDDDNLRRPKHASIKEEDDFWGSQDEKKPKQNAEDEEQAKVSKKLNKAEEEEEEFWANYKKKKSLILNKTEEEENSFWGSDENGKSPQVDDNKKEKLQFTGKTQEEGSDFWAESDENNDIQVKTNVKSTVEVEDAKTTQTTESTYEMKQKSVVDDEFGTGDQEVTMTRKVISSTTYEEYEQKPDADDIWGSESADAILSVKKTRNVSSAETTKEQSEEGQAIDDVWGNSDTYEIARKFKPKTDVEEEPQEAMDEKSPRKFISKDAKDTDTDDFWGNEDKSEVVSKAQEKEKTAVELSANAGEEDDIWGNGDDDWSRTKPKVEVEEDPQVSKVLDRTKSMSDTDGAGASKEPKKGFASKYDDMEPGIIPCPILYPFYICFTFIIQTLHYSTHLPFLHGVLICDLPMICFLCQNYSLFAFSTCAVRTSTFQQLICTFLVHRYYT